MERNGEINKYRYTKLYEILLSVSDMEIITYDLKDEESTKETIGNFNNKFGKMRKKYVAAKSILDEKHYSYLDCLFGKESEISNDLRLFQNP